MASLLESLLAPVAAGNNPAGQDLSSTLVRELGEARTPRYDPEKEKASLLPIEWPKIIKDAREALREKSKDLRIAGYLAEALVKEEGFAGLRDGLKLIGGLLENFWENLYPAIREDGSVKARISALSWLDRELAAAIKQVPLTGGPNGGNCNYLQWAESRQFDIPDNFDDLIHTERDRLTEMRERAAREGKTTSEQWRKAKAATPPEFYAQLGARLDESWDALQSLVEVMEAKFTRPMPGLEPLVKAMQQESPNADVIVAILVEVKPYIEADDSLALFRDELGEALRQTTLDAMEISRLRARLMLHESPGLAALTNSLDEVRAAVKKFAPENSTQLQVSTGDALMTQLNQPLVSPAVEPGIAPKSLPSNGSSIISSREQALAQLALVARYFRETEPHSPVAPLVERAIKWGRMELTDWLEDVIKDSDVLSRLRETLGVTSKS